MHISTPSPAAIAACAHSCGCLLANYGWILLVILSPTLSPAQNWRPLFDGKSIAGWEQHGGRANFVVEDGVLVGRAVANSPNSFLCTRERFSNFIFEAEVFLPNALNSGVMFRAQLQASNDRIYGYQCEIDPEARAWTGGLYDEGRRKWLYPLTYNEPARKAFRLGTWNAIRIEALGSELRTYINGEMASRVVDDTDTAGVFGLQVHSINDPAQVGYEVRWRNLRVLTDSVATYRLSPEPGVQEVSFRQNQLTDYERDHGWRLLWDGKTSDGWRGAKLPGFPDKGWSMKDGVLTIAATDGGESTGAGDIVTERHYGDFELELDFRLTAGANSGVKYFVDPALNQGAGSAIGCEFQFLDDERHPDAKLGIAGNRTLGSLYDLIPAQNMAYGRSKQLNPIGEWNRARIISRGGHVEHWLNGEPVVVYERFSQTFAALVNASKYKDWPNFGRWPAGAILLQDHGNEVSFRSIKLREL